MNIEQLVKYLEGRIESLNTVNYDQFANHEIIIYKKLLLKIKSEGNDKKE